MQAIKLTLSNLDISHFSNVHLFFTGVFPFSFICVLFKTHFYKKKNNSGKGLGLFVFVLPKETENERVTQERVCTRYINAA